MGGKVADEITGMGEKRKRTVRGIITRMFNRSPIAVAKRLKAEASSAVDTSRDWLRVARTEKTNADGIDSYDELLLDLGEGALVCRDTHNCCDACARLFGRPGRPKSFRLGKIDDSLIGAAHPNCKCGPWRAYSATTPMAKADRVLPFGFVRRRFGDGIYPVEVSNGSIWVAPDSLTGRQVLKAVLRATPLVVVSTSGPWAKARHGHGRPEGEFFQTISPLKAMGARYYTRDPDADPDGYMASIRFRQSRSFEEYLEIVLQVLPAVLAMPEFWGPNGMGQKFVSEFMGYKSLTDWWVYMPPKQDYGRICPTGTAGVRATARRAAQAELQSDRLKKKGT